VTGATARFTRSLATRPFSTLLAPLLIATLAAVSAACGGSSSNTPPTPPAPAVSLPSSVAFGNVGQGTASPPMTVTLTNAGTATLSFSANPSVSGTNAADFTITAMTCSTANALAAGASCSVTLTFKPSTTTTESGSLTFTDNAANSPQSVVLSGTGQVPVAGATVPATLPFGSVVQGVTSGVMTVTLTSSGNIPLNFTATPAISGANAADFLITSATCVVGTPVAANSTCDVAVTFTPSTLTMETASLVFTDNAPNSSQSVALTGTGVAMLNNVVSASVNAGPVPNITPNVNVMFISVTVCEPGTTNCQTIPNIAVDTGSEGLRIMSSVVNPGLSFPQVNATNGNPLASCVSFLDSTFLWGPVQLADVQLGGEKAPMVPIQIIEPPTFASVPSQCSSGGTDVGSVDEFGAFGIIGVGSFRQDCGQSCVTTAVPPSPFVPPYFSCIANSNSCTATTATLLQQMQNPVWMLPAPDNNGVVVQLPQVAATGALTATGSLILGIGTESNNGLGSATLLTTDANGFITTTFNNVAYNESFFDSGSNGLFVLDPSLSNLPNCGSNSGAQGFSCPTNPVTFNVTNSANGTPAASAPASFTITSAVTLFGNNGGLNTAFNNLGGPYGTPPPPTEFDFGLSFFFGRSIFTGIESQPGPGGVLGPYFAY